MGVSFRGYIFRVSLDGKVGHSLYPFSTNDWFKIPGFEKLVSAGWISLSWAVEFHFN